MPHGAAGASGCTRMMPPRQAHTSTPAAARFGPMNPGPSMSETVAVIPCYNHPQTIGLMVDAVRAHQLAVIVVDDGSDAVCAEVLDGLARRHGATLTLLRLEHNLCQSGANIAGPPPPPSPPLNPTPPTPT